MAKITTQLSNTNFINISYTSQLINNGDDNTSTYVETDELGVVAFTNDYNDLDNLPFIPTQYTDENSQDAIGNILLNTSTIDLNYNDIIPSISANIIPNSITSIELSDNINISEFVNDENYIDHTDLTYTSSPINGVVNSDVGSDAIIPSATITNAGLFLPSEKINLSNQSGINTGDQNSIVGITGIKSEYNTSLTDGDFLFVGDITQYTDELAQDTIGGILIDSSTIDFTYNDGTPSITASVVPDSITATELSNSINISEFLNDTGYITNTNLTYISSPTNGIVVSDTGTDATIPTVDFTNAGLLSPEERQLLYNNSSTGLVSFGGLSINVDTTKYDVGAIKGWFVDNHTNPLLPTKIFKSFIASTANVVTNIGTQNVTYIAIDINGVLQQSSTPFQPEIQRDWIPLGVIVHSNLVSINAINNQPVVATDTNSQLSDLLESIGFFNITGNVFSPNGANLNINKSAGSVFKQGVNFINDNKDPHTLNLAALVAPSNIRYRTRFGVETVDSANIIPGFYDDAGVVTVVPGTRWTIQRIYVFQSNLIRIQYGQATYNSLTDAIQAISTEAFVVEQNILENGLFRGLLIIRDNTTDLTDLSRALFIEASKFGSVAGLGSLSTSTLQQAYNNSTTPEITTNSILGAVSLKRGSVADTDTVLEIQNGAGTNTVTITGEGTGFFRSLTLRNIANTFTGTWQNLITAARTWTLPDATGTIALISQVITNGVTTNAPSEDTVFDALALKEDLTNKATNLTSPDNTKYPTTLAVSNAILSKITAIDSAGASLNNVYEYSGVVVLGVGTGLWSINLTSLAFVSIINVQLTVERTTTAISSQSHASITATPTVTNLSVAITESAGILLGGEGLQFTTSACNLHLTIKGTK